MHKYKEQMKQETHQLEKAKARWEHETGIVLLKITYALEIVVSIFLILALIVSMLAMASSLHLLAYSGGGSSDFHVFLEHLFTVVIGIELLKMLCNYNTDSVIEVLLFTLARQLVLNHGSAVDQLVSVLAIGILFLIRKFLFIRNLDRPEELDEEEIKQQIKEEVEEELRIEAEQLQVEKAELKEEAEQLQVEKAELKEEVEQLQEEKAELKEEAELLKEEKAELREEKAVLREEKAELREEKAALKEEVEQLEEEKAALEMK